MMWENRGLLLFLLTVSPGLAALGAWMMIHAAPSFGLLDEPNTRSSHSSVIPKGGGLGILASFILASLILGFSAVFWMPIVGMAAIGFAADRIDIAPRLRLPLQLLLAAATVAGSRDHTIEANLPVLLFICWVIYITGTANFYNFMDGINGIAGLSGVVGFGLLACYLYINGIHYSGALLSSAMAFACLGFLPFNMPKAQIFMGDVGSILLGAAFAAVVFLAANSLLDFLCLTSFLFPFYADELSTMAVRLWDRENLTKPHRRHVYQLLVNERGLKHWQVAIYYALLQLTIGASVIGVRTFGLIGVLGLLLFWFGSFIIAGAFIRSNSAKT